eukprot:GFKZ01000152.1.p1 GENE.GFKZ01000152.1~~GFKZ01000152.1.p1  ORF type:complete len:907 (-),score=94.67 GFKZ01000152.1:56-2683(-)
MHSLARGESRARRSASTDAPISPPNSSRSHSPLAASYPFYQHPSLLLSILQAVSYTIPTLSTPPYLLLFPSFLIAFLFLLLYMRIRHTMHLPWRHPRIPQIAVLQLASVICLVICVRKIGPLRSAIAGGAMGTRKGRRRIWLRATLTFFALGFLVIDVQERHGGVEGQSAHVVHARLSKLSEGVKSRYQGAQKRFAKSIRGAVRRQIAGRLGTEEVIQAQAKGEQPMDEPETVDIPPEPVMGEEGRRRLLAVVKEEQDGGNDEPEAKEGSLLEEGPEKSGRQEKDRGDERVNYPATSTMSAMYGVFFAVCYVATGKGVNEVTAALVHDGGDWVALTSVAFLQCALFLLPFFAMYCATRLPGEGLNWPEVIGNVMPRGGILALSLMVAPTLLQPRRRELSRRSGAQRSAKTFGQESVWNRIMSAMGSNAGPKREAPMRSVTLLSVMLLTRIGMMAQEESDSLSVYSAIAALILMAISRIESLDSRNGSLDASIRDLTRSSSSSELTLFVGKGALHAIRHFSKSVQRMVSRIALGLKDLVAHARTNKASWQVLNFLVLQSGMATVELVYASVTHAAGLISISADNFFCTVALAVGLFAIRVTSRKATSAYSYGFSRFESVCGFANGIMLIYVAILIVLEAFERLIEKDKVAVGHTFTVCIFGMTGNILGLYFFPPESRRENHNVQGIYLHIWANTLAFASMAASTAISAAVPTWELVDTVTAAVVAVGVISLAIPLLIRSGRLLLLQVPLEKRAAFNSSKLRLNEIDGVVRISGLRLWNLTPNCLVGSVRLEVADRYKGSDEEVLYKARAVFASMGVPASQCTVQICRVEADNPAVIFFHKRTPSGLGETGIDLDALSLSRELREHHTECTDRGELT